MKMVKKLFFTIALALFVALGLAACGGKKGVNIFTDAPNRKATKIEMSEVELEYAYPDLVDKTTDEDGVKYANAYDNPKNDYSLTYKEESKESKELVDKRINPMSKAIGFAFDGWFKDEKFENEAVFPLTLKKGESLYAKYIRKASEPNFIGIDTRYPNDEFQIKDISSLGEFSPLGGLDCLDDEGNKYEMTTDFEDIKPYITGDGEYQFTISGSFTKPDHRGTQTVFKTERTIFLIVGEKSDIQLEVPMAITYYKNIGEVLNTEKIREYVTGFNRTNGEQINTDQLEILGLPENLNEAIDNEFSITVSIKDTKGITSRGVVKVHVKEKPSLVLPTLNELKTKSQEKTIEITLWHSNGDAIENALFRYVGHKDWNKDKYPWANTTATKNFVERMNDLGVKVQVNIVKNGNSYDELLKSVINANQGGEMPNIVQGYPDHFYEYNNSKTLQSLLPYIHHEDYGYGKEDGTVFEVQGGWDDIFPKYREEQMGSTAEGDVLSIPFQKSTEVMIYNKDFFTLIGKEVPKTWEDLMELAPTIKAKKDEYIDSVNVPNKAESKELFVPYTYDSSANAFINLTKQNGGIYTSRIQQKGKYRGRLNFVNNQQSKAAIRKFGEWSLAGNISTASIRFNGATYSSDSFKEAKCVVTMSSSAGARYNLPYLNGAVVFEPGFAPIPYFKGGKPSVIQQGPSLAMISDLYANGSERFTPEQNLVSWLFMKFLTSKEIQADFVVSTGYLPVRKSVDQVEDYRNFIALADTTLASIAQGTGSEDDKKRDMERVLQARSIKAATQSAAYQSFDIPFIGSNNTRTEVGKIYDQVMANARADALDKVISDAYTAADNALRSIVR